MWSPTKRARGRRPSTSSSPADDDVSVLVSDRQSAVIGPGRVAARTRKSFPPLGTNNQMILRSSPASQFGRKVGRAAIVLGLNGGIPDKPADTADPGDSVRQQNPLGKIPALVLDDGMVLFDSRVILEYLAHLAGGGA